jgi:hypothetical protein
MAASNAGEKRLVFRDITSRISLHMDAELKYVLPFEIFCNNLFIDVWRVGSGYLLRN